VPAPSSYDYALIRVVPRVERQEFVNAGVIVWCRDHDVLEARTALDEARLRALDPGVDLETVRRHLLGIEVVCRGGAVAGPIGRMSKRERFDWLVAPRSTMIQSSPVHSGHSADMVATLEHLLDKMVRD
jgi:hypothetical protein